MRRGWVSEDEHGVGYLWWGVFLGFALVAVVARKNYEWTEPNGEAMYPAQSSIAGLLHWWLAACTVILVAVIVGFFRRRIGAIVALSGVVLGYLGVAVAGDSAFVYYVRAHSVHIGTRISIPQQLVLWTVAMLPLVLGLLRLMRRWRSKGASLLTSMRREGL